MSVVFQESLLSDQPLAERAAMPPFPTCRFTVDDYHQMISAGIISEHDRVELLEGWIVPKMGHKPPHRISVALIPEALRLALPPGWHLQVQLPITTAESEPEPDVSVVRGHPRDYANRHPGPKDVGLAVEASDSSLEEDRTHMGRLYARARLPFYWIVNLVDRKVEVYADPTGPAENPYYRRRQDYGIGDAVPLVLDGVEVGRISVRDLLP